MSHDHHAVAFSTSGSNFQLILSNALDKYKKRTKNDLITHPLAAQLQSCDSPNAILAVLQGIDQSRSSDERWSRWLDPTVNVIYALSSTVAAGLGLIFSPSNVIFAGIGILLSAAQDVRASQETLVDIFERIEMFFRRLEVYTELSTTTMEMMDITIQIMVEILSFLGIATKEIKQGRMKKYLKKLTGGTDMEDVLKKLDKLTQEEARMAAAQNLKATHTVDKRVQGVADTAVAIDNRVAGVDVRVAGVSDQVAGVSDQVAGLDDRVANTMATVDDRVKVVDNKITEVIADGNEVKTFIQQTANDVDQVKRNQLRESIHKWLSPPDPSTNHNIACGTRNKKTAAWFFQGSIFQEWKTTGSLLWIHGKPGSGKSIICSSVIQDIEAMCEAGHASMGYFYFDFRDANKQGLGDLIPSLLTQLSAHSGPRCDILSDLYAAHDEGKKQPSDSVLAQCLKKMLTLPDQRPTYLIIDALDESSNNSGIPSPRETVLQLLEELVDLSLTNLRICVTSRPEIDIRNVLEPLTSCRVSLHDQSGQRKDIEDYVRSVVYSGSEQIMKRWKKEDKELVIETLSERADGMFRWVFCQLESLRHCLPPSVRRTLDELPESLDETYDRVLKDIKKPNRDHARRLLQCLVVAIRPLDVKELAEVLAVDFDDADEIPKLKPDWRWEDEEQALLTSCSSLVTTVKTDDSRVVQFSHFSVKEYLTSERLATSSGDISRYHIALEPAHTILAQACIGVLLQTDDGVEENGSGMRSPLAVYAAQKWVTHAQFERASRFLRKAMEYLFDPEKPYFASWLQLHDIDTRPNAYSSSLAYFSVTEKPGAATPLYYAALCGFEDLVEHLVVKYPQHVNTTGGHCATPLIAALERRHFQIADRLRRDGARVDVRSFGGRTSLDAAATYGDIKMVQVLLDFKADVNAVDHYGWTPILGVARGSDTLRVPHPIIPQLWPDVARLLLDNGADVNAPMNHTSPGLDGLTPLHLPGTAAVARMLLEYGANVGATDKQGQTPLHRAANGGDCGDRSEANTKYRKFEIARVLLEYGASIDAKDNEGRTPLHAAAVHCNVKIVHLLLEHGANVDVVDNQGTTPLLATAEFWNRKAESSDGEAEFWDEDAEFWDGEAKYERVEVTRVLLEHGANVGAKDKQGRTAFQIASARGADEIMKLLSEYGANCQGHVVT